MEEDNKEVEKDLSQNKEQNKTILIHGIRNLIVGEINQFILNSHLGLFAVMVYRISYLREFQEEKTLDLQYIYFIPIVFQITMAVINLFSPSLQKKVGLRGVIIIGLIINISSNIILYFSKKYIIDLLSYFMMAVGFMGLILMSRNVMYFFFEIRGKLLGALSIIKALLGMGFNYISELIFVNPESDEADVDGRFYTFNISKNVLNYIIMNIILSISCNILNLFILVPYDKKKHGKGISFKKGNKNQMLINDEEEKIINNNDEKDNNEDENEDKEKLEKIKKEKQNVLKIIIKKAFKTRRIIFLILMSFFSTPLGSFLGMQWRNIAIRNNIPTSFQQFILIINQIIGCFATLVFSWLSDSIPFRYLYSGLSFVITFISIFYCFTFKSPYLFTITILFYALTANGRVAISLPHFMKVFGLEYYIQISTIISIPSTLLGPICNIFMFLFDNAYALNEDNGEEVSNSPYFILYIILGLLNGISAFLGLFETEDILKIIE